MQRQYPKKPLLSLFFNVAPTDSPSGTGDGTDATLPSGAPPTVAAGALFVATASFIAALLWTCISIVCDVADND